MITVTPTATQTFSCIPRTYNNTGDYTLTDVIVTDQDTNKSYNISITTATEVKYYLDVTLTFPNDSYGNLILNEGTFYTLEGLKGTDVKYRDILFCTSQTLSDYSIQTDNSGDPIYTENSTTNEYVVI